MGVRSVTMGVRPLGGTGRRRYQPRHRASPRGSAAQWPGSNRTPRRMPSTALRPPPPHQPLGAYAPDRYPDSPTRCPQRGTASPPRQTGSTFHKTPPAPPDRPIRGCRAPPNRARPGPTQRAPPRRANQAGPAPHAQTSAAWESARPAESLPSLRPFNSRSCAGSAIRTISIPSGQEIFDWILCTQQRAHRGEASEQRFGSAPPPHVSRVTVSSGMPGGTQFLRGGVWGVGCRVGGRRSLRRTGSVWRRMTVGHRPKTRV